MLPGTGITELSIKPSRINPGPPSVNSQCRTACTFEGAASTNLAISNLNVARPRVPIYFIRRSPTNHGSGTGAKTTHSTRASGKMARGVLAYIRSYAGRRKAARKPASRSTARRTTRFSVAFRRPLSPGTTLILGCLRAFSSLVTRHWPLHLSSPYSLALC